MVLHFYIYWQHRSNGCVQLSHSGYEGPAREMWAHVRHSAVLAWYAFLTSNIFRWVPFLLRVSGVAVIHTQTGNNSSVLYSQSYMRSYVKQKLQCQVVYMFNRSLTNCIFFVTIQFTPDAWLVVKHHQNEFIKVCYIKWF